MTVADSPRRIFLRTYGGQTVVPPAGVDPDDFDELIASNADVHIEMMDEDHLWMRVGGYMVNVWSERLWWWPWKTRLRVRAEWDGS